MHRGIKMDTNKNKPNVILGSLFIIIGLALFLNIFFDISFFNMRYLWPLFVLLPGLFLEAAYFTGKKAPALLIPGGILITNALLFFFEIVTQWQYAAYTWPIYIIAVVVGLFQFSVAIRHPKGLIIAIVLLLVVAIAAMVSITCYAIFRILPHRIILPISFIALGAYCIYAGLRKK